MKKLICFLILSASLDVFAQDAAAPFDAAKYKKLCDQPAGGQIDGRNATYCREAFKQYYTKKTIRSQTLAAQTTAVEKSASSQITAASTTPTVLSVGVDRVEDLKTEVVKNGQELESARVSVQSVFSAEDLLKLEIQIDTQSQSIVRTKKAIEDGRATKASQAYLEKLDRVLKFETSELDRMKRDYESKSEQVSLSPAAAAAASSVSQLQNQIDTQSQSIARTKKAIEDGKATKASQAYLDKLDRVLKSETAELERMKQDYGSASGKSSQAESVPQTAAGSVQTYALGKGPSTPQLQVQELSTKPAASARALEIAQTTKTEEAADRVLTSVRSEANQREIDNFRRQIQNKDIESSFSALKKENLQLQKRLDLVSEKYDNALVGHYVREKFKKVLNSKSLCESMNGCRGNVRSQEVSKDRIKAEIFNFNNEVKK